MMVDEAEPIVFRLSAAHNLAGVPTCRAERRASGLHDLSHCRPVWLLFSWLVWFFFPLRVAKPREAAFAPHNHQQRK